MRLLSLAAMAHLPLLLIFFLLLGVLASISRGSPPPLSSTYDSPVCSKDVCGRVNISYPFYLSKAIGETYNTCGYTGFNITCITEEGIETPIIQFNGDSYTVLDISYNTRIVVLADTDALRGGSCPRVRHGFTFGQADKWLEYAASRDTLTFFFGCSSVPPDLPPASSAADEYRIKCREFNNSPSTEPSFVFTSKELYALPDYQSLSQLWNCNQTIVVPVDGGNPLMKDQAMLPSDGYGKVLKKGFELAWNSSKDERSLPCEQSQGQCVYRQNKTFLRCVCSDVKLGVKDCYSPSEGITSPISQEIHGKYLDAIVKEVDRQYDRFKKDWPMYGVTLMCDS